MTEQCDSPLAWNCAQTGELGALLNSLSWGWPGHGLPWITRESGHRATLGDQDNEAGPQGAKL